MIFNKTQIKLFYLIIITFIINYNCQAEGMWGSILNIELNKKISDFFTIELEGEHRTRKNMTENDRWKIDLLTSYKINKFLKVGTGYNYIYYNHETKDWENRHRYFINITGSVKINQFKINLVERIQGTYREGISEYNKNEIKIRSNPKYILRSKLAIEYDIINCKFTPEISTELFYSLNDVEENNLYKIRYTGTGEYKINNNNYIKLFFRYSTFHNFNEDDDESNKIIGIGYKIKF